MNVQDAQSASNSTVMTGDVRVDIARKIYVGDKWHSGANKPLFAVREVTHDGRVREKLVVPPQIAVSNDPNGRYLCGIHATSRCKAYTQVSGT